MGVNSKWKEFAPLGTNSYLNEWTQFERVLLHKSKTLFVKMEEKHEDVYIHLNQIHVLATVVTLKGYFKKIEDSNHQQLIESDPKPCPQYTKGRKSQHEVTPVKNETNDKPSQRPFPKYSWLSLSRTPSDSLKYIEIPVLPHFRFPDLRKKI